MSKKKTDWTTIIIAGVVILVSLLDIGLNIFGIVPYVGALLESFSELVLEAITIIGVTVLAIKGINK